MKIKNYFLLLTVWILSISCISPALIHAKTEQLSDSVTARKRMLFEYAVAEMFADKKTVITSITSVKDFAGNPYSVIECKPAGYMIFCETSGVFVEYSPTAQSPYKDVEGELFYGGPTYYYTRSSKIAELKHTLIADEILLPENVLQCRDSSEAFLKYNLSRKNEPLFDYIRTGETKESIFSTAVNTANKAKAATTGQVSHSDFFANMLSPCGYYSQNETNTICGYIGLALMIAYRDKYRNDEYMNNNYWEDSSTKSNLKNGKRSFAAYLRKQYGDKDSVNGAEIKKVSEKYFEGRKVNVTHMSKSWGFFNRNTIMDAIDNDNPVLLIGGFEDPVNNGKSINHAVVAYAYSDQGGLFGATVYKAHFGFDNYSDVYISGTIGSIYILK